MFVVASRTLPHRTRRHRHATPLTDDAGMGDVTPVGAWYTMPLHTSPWDRGPRAGRGREKHNYTHN